MRLSHRVLVHTKVLRPDMIAEHMVQYLFLYVYKCRLGISLPHFEQGTHFTSVTVAPEENFISYSLVL